MFKKGDRVKKLGSSETGTFIGAAPEKGCSMPTSLWVRWDDGTASHAGSLYWSKNITLIEDGQWGADPYYPTHGEVTVNEPDEFDQGGLKRMSDGTLESVHIPEEEKVIPYTATGIGGPVPKPKKLRFNVTWGTNEAVVGLQEPNEHMSRLCRREVWNPIPSYIRYVSRYGFFGCKRSPEKMRQLIAKAKAELLQDYDVAEKESGLV